MAFHYSLFLSREGSSSSPADPLFMWQCDAAERKPLGIGWGKLQTKKGLLLPYMKSKFQKGAPLPPKLQASAQRLFSRCCLLLFLQAQKSLFRLPSLSPFWLIRFFLLRASAWFAPFVLHFFVILRFSLRFSDSRDPTFISYLFQCQLHVLGGPSGQFSYHCWKPLRLFGCVLPVRVSHTPHLFFFSYFIFLSTRSASCRQMFAGGDWCS